MQVDGKLALELDPLAHLDFIRARRHVTEQDEEGDKANRAAGHNHRQRGDLLRPRNPFSNCSSKVKIEEDQRGNDDADDGSHFKHVLVRDLALLHHALSPL